MKAIEKRNIPISLPVTGEEEWHATREPLVNGWLTSGPKVREFEELFAKRHQVKHALAVTSATTALHLALVALDVKAGDEIIVPAFTWVSTANVVLYCGATVVFADVDPHTFNIDPADLKRRITPKTKAIIPVHLFGLCANMDEIKTIAGNIPLVEDGACAAGAAYKGIPAGALGTIGCFSFHPRKSITTGEGGMITTNDDHLAEVMGMLRNHGASISEEQRHHGPRPYILPDFNMLGYNYRMTDLQGAVGVVQIKKLDQFIDEREKWAAFYTKELSSIPWLRTPKYGADYKHGWQSFVTFVDEAKAPMSRNDIMEKLQEQGISTRPGTHAVHMLGYYAKTYNIQPKDYPGAWSADQFSMSIPLHNRMVKEDFEYVVSALKSI
ncbi:MAG: perosamine synthetase [Sphingobacteriales bacterium 17-39-43]|uniref:DegT/DnrJ/EryC1/StrS family aminotransferase n=1 Tax=Daejeonella sp. TaxID=2805397 RepID=UPI000BD4FE9C|nr:DegT/DnrJ/EryC1/StrS family aminotransferase [Daejeonella sp.]OYZ30182.1 MAG: perosamine synthetase [Sphingobacteriales bacterium 16-39-50]OZA22925.1 MAG: perosamine synthetase [Sphingobacteriales bacterium 17-39-43]HQT24182.1 DegT/DnrJ/EryC1/StrS family aminotransferase [Daejeonella sp.]HQT58792.1 DegT/DnrJ/EryC1/StrS family aminotransferase [Daejeonella sp.]